MRRFTYLFFMIIIFTFTTGLVNASCTNEEINNLKKEANKIKVTYRHLGAIENDEQGIEYNHFNVTFKNVSDDLYIELFNFTYTNRPENGIIVDTFTTGNWNFGIYSDKCEERISSIDVYLPKFNVYSLDPLCDGIDGNDFALCGKYYNYNVSYGNFKERVIAYRNTHEIVSDSKNSDVNNKNISYYLKYVWSFIVDNYVIFGIFGFVLILVLISLIIMKIRKNRGVLK